jgi:hypothetical protein
MLEKRFSRGLQFQAAYTWSKSFDQASSFEGQLNPYDFHRTYSLSQFDARHRFVLSYYWELPLPKFQGAAGTLLNGWDLSGIYTYQTGFPIRISSSADNELIGSFFFETAGEPDQIGPFRVIDPKTEANAGHYFDVNAFTDNAFDDSAPLCSDSAEFNCFNPDLLGRFGNAPRTICCGPSINNFDFALHKVTPIGERARVEFRVEFFNLFNHTQFFNPLGDTQEGEDFGRILRAKDPRQVQFALKLFF